MHSENGISNTTMDMQEPMFSANSTSNFNGVSFIGSINFSPSITASISFFRMAIPLAAISYNTGFSAVVDNLSGKLYNQCKSNSFNLTAFGNFKGSIGNFSRNMLRPITKKLKSGCINPIPE